MLKPKITVLYDKNGCCFWRSYLPHLNLQKEGLADIKFIELRYTNSKELAEALKWADFVHRIGIVEMPDLVMMRTYQQLGVKFVVDYDDLHFNISPWNPKYKVLGTDEVQLEDGTWLWKDGVNGFDLKKNQFKFHVYKTALKEADIITTTTLYLKNAIDEISEYKANVSVIPNAVDFNEWKSLDVRHKYSDKFRFGWAVSGSHGEDWIFFKDILISFLKSHPDAKFVCIGDTYMDIKKGLHVVENQIEWYPWSDLWEGHYQLRIPMLGLDCAIMPLADTEFNRCKSPLKWAEMTAFGFPVVAQNIEPYSSHIQNGQTGLLANTKEEWLLALNQLYGDSELRKKLRFNALLSAKSFFDIKEVVKDWYKMYMNFDKVGILQSKT